MDITRSNVLTGIVLLGAIAHLMIYMNGYWNSVFWMTAIMVIAVPIAVQKLMGKGRRTRKSRIPREI